MTKTPSHNVNSTRFRPHAHAMLEVNTMYMTYMHATNTCKDSKLKNSNNFDPVPKNLCYHREHHAHGHQLRHYHSHRSSPDATMTPTLLAYTNTDWASARTPGNWRRGFVSSLRQLPRLPGPKNGRNTVTMPSAEAEYTADR